MVHPWFYRDASVIDYYQESIYKPWQAIQAAKAAASTDARTLPYSLPEPLEAVEEEDV